MTEKETVIADLEAAKLEALLEDQSKFDDAISFVQTLPDNSPLLEFYKPYGRTLWIPPIF